MHDAPRRSFARCLFEALYFHSGLLPWFGLGRTLGIPHLYWQDSLSIRRRSHARLSAALAGTLAA